MKILVPGGHGQVGCEVVRHGEKSCHEIIAASRVELDITDFLAVVDWISAHKPDAVLNAAAYTAVDKAEQESQQAHAVNCDGAANLARACAEAGIPLLHISTDYVFDGRQNRAYREDDPASPLGVYGESKWQGELKIREYCPQHIILRTSWVFGEFGHNFVRTVLRLAQDHEELRIVADQQGCPTHAGAIAQCLLKIAEQLVFSPSSVFGTYHYGGVPASNWHGFAQAIIAEARTLTILPAQRVVPITTADYPTPAARPANSVLDCNRLQTVFDIQPAPWCEGLRRVLSAWLSPA